MSGISFDQARELCEAALQAGCAAGAPLLTVAVLNARANLRALYAEDRLGIAMP